MTDSQHIKSADELEEIVKAMSAAGTLKRKRGRPVKISDDELLWAHGVRQKLGIKKGGIGISGTAAFFEKQGRGTKSSIQRKLHTLLKKQPKKKKVRKNSPIKFARK